MSDLISRQAAIEKINAGFLTEDNCYVECVAECNSMLDFAISEIKELPSAQPEADEWCASCKEYDHDKHCCPRWNRVIRTALEEAQPERKRGKWIPFDIPWYKCSECGAVRENKSFMENFCPNCGAKMDQEERK